mmetsp:Transcript_25151/g.81370  ORF Transcript_25151/g.81370 Transcript_25151/m.81370 type:complete len:236 (-) Transcript_25151:629-1336(-)
MLRSHPHHPLTRLRSLSRGCHAFPLTGRGTRNGQQTTAAEDQTARPARSGWPAAPLTAPTRPLASLPSQALTTLTASRAAPGGGTDARMTTTPAATVTDATWDARLRGPNRAAASQMRRFRPRMRWRWTGRPPASPRLHRSPTSRCRSARLELSRCVSSPGESPTVRGRITVEPTSAAAGWPSRPEQPSPAPPAPSPPRRLPRRFTPPRRRIKRQRRPSTSYSTWATAAGCCSQP